jgi:hypothetical protein
MKAAHVVRPPLSALVALAWLALSCAGADAGVSPASTGDAATPRPSPGNSFPNEPAYVEPTLVENSQTGSIGQAVCLTDSDCGVEGATELQGPRGHVEFVAAACTHTVSNDGLPTCECRMRMTRYPDAQTVAAELEPYEGTLHPGNRPDRCSEYSRAPGCLYCENEFPGCDIGDANSCDAVCADMTERLELDLQTSLRVSTRLARCVSPSRCDVVTEIDGQCYAGPPESHEPARLDCGLPDAELIQHLDAPGVASCEPRPVVSCAASEDCPRGLACNAGRCESCSVTCVIAEGQEAACTGGGVCATGESCTSGTCVPAGNTECRDSSDCPPNHSCSLTGISAAGRGNANTQSFCRPYP